MIIRLQKDMIDYIKRNFLLVIILHSEEQKYNRQMETDGACAPPEKCVTLF